MKKAILAVIMAMGLVSIQAQNEKNLVVDANVEVRNASGFTGIEVSGSIDLYISQGTEEAVAISANSDEIKGRIKTEVRNGILHIFLDGKGLNWKTWSNHKMKAYVTYKTLERLEASGASNIRTADIIRQSNLRIELSGASDFTGDVAVTKLKISTSGASNMKISGTADNTEFDANGACSVKAYDLKTDMCKIDASGASNIRVTVNKELNAVASGGSTIYYRGTGLIRDISTSGGATVKRRVDD